MWQEALWTHGRYLLEKSEGGDLADGGGESFSGGEAGGVGLVWVEEGCSSSRVDGEKRQDWLYESYYRMSQQHPLFVFLLLIVMGACLALLLVFFASGLYGVWRGNEESMCGFVEWWKLQKVVSF
ncbi:unnamed protein product [Merluccius merluccius]